MTLTFDDTLLEGVERRALGMLAIQHNARRIVSTGAKVDKTSLEQRPCFLCRDNRPATQAFEEWTAPSGVLYELLVNPFPILSHHMTIPTRAHEPQTMDTERLGDLQALAKYLGWPYVAFYNGPHCGASAPDHAHFQAGWMSEVPLVQMIENEGSAESYPCKVYVNEVPEDLLETNILCWWKDGRLTTVVIPRTKHRPAVYPDVMISPGAIDMSGLLIAPRKEDFEAMTEEAAKAILKEVGQ